MKRKFLIPIALLFSVSFISAQENNSELKPYVDFLETQQTTAKDYILDLFKKYDIVILCERDHREITQYDLILDILGDKRFTNGVKNAYFEIGNAQYNDTLNRFLHNPSLTPEEVSKSVMYFQRNSYGAPLWEKSNYSYYIKGVYDINKTLSNENKINIHGLDIGVKWESATEEDIRIRDSLVANCRDSILADNFIRYFKRQNTGKAFVVLNYRHAFVKDLFGVENAGRFIADTYKCRVANVYLNSFALKRKGNSPISAMQDGKWDAAFIKANKQNIGFDFLNTPFGKDSLDIYHSPNNFTFSDIFTGFVYYNYFPDLLIVAGIEGYIDDEFAPELMRRYKLEQKVYNNQLPEINDLKSNYNIVEKVTYKEDTVEFSEAIKAIEDRLQQDK